MRPYLGHAYTKTLLVGYLKVKFNCVSCFLLDKLTQRHEGAGQGGDGRTLLGEAGGGIPQPLHSEEAFQKFLQAPMDTEGSWEEWLVCLPTGRLALLRAIPPRRWRLMPSQAGAGDLRRLSSSKHGKKA